LGSSKRESGQTVIAAVPVSVIAAGPAVPPELSSSPGDSVSSTVPAGPRRARKERTGADRGHPKQEKCPRRPCRQERALGAEADRDLVPPGEGSQMTVAGQHEAEVVEDRMNSRGKNVPGAEAPPRAPCTFTVSVSSTRTSLTGFPAASRSSTTSPSGPRTSTST